MKQLVDEGYLGELKMVRVIGLNDMWQNRPWGWIMEKSKQGGILQAQGSHLIDSLQWWFGPIVEVGAQLDTLLTSRPTESGEWRACDAEDQVAALMRFANGAPVNYLISGSIRPGQNRFEAYGSEGTLIIDESKLLGARGTDAPREIEPGTSLPKLEAGEDFRLAPFLAFLERFMPRLRGEPAPEMVAGFREGVAVQAVMDAMRQSDEEKRFVAVEAV
jgi:predicted dehydrogenase